MSSEGADDNLGHIYVNKILGWPGALDHAQDSGSAGGNAFGRSVLSQRHATVMAFLQSPEAEKPPKQSKLTKQDEVGSG